MNSILFLYTVCEGYSLISNTSNQSECFAEVCLGSAEEHEEDFMPCFHHLLLQCFILSAQNDSTVQSTHYPCINKKK